jgi:hypothetical protein
MMQVNNPTTQNWQAGLLNYGLPVNSYRTGGLRLGPPAFPNFIPPRVLQFGTQGYPQAWISRYAFFAGGILGNTGIVQDLARYPIGGTNQAQWLPCNSGLFEKNQPGETDPLKMKNYYPSDIVTPCNDFGQQ